MFSDQFVFLRPWIICHGQPSIAVSNTTTATVGSSRFDVQTNIAAWHLLSWTIEKVCATSKPVYGHKQANSIMSEYRWRLEKYVGLRQSGARLAHLSRLRTTTDSHFTSVYRDDDYCGLELDNTLYAFGFLHHRPVPCRCSPGLGFAKPKRLSNSIPCWNCTAISRHSSISPKENCMM